MSETPLLVASCDKYADLWEPFFTLLWKQWPDCPYPIYLGSNYKVYADKRVATITVGEDISWATSVLQMLDYLKTDYVILFLEDFLIKRSVDTKAVDHLVHIAKEKKVGCLRLAALMPLALPPTRPLAEIPGIGVIEPGDPYRVTAQAAVWRVETLRCLLVPGSNAWEFETLGTQLSEEISHPFWGVYEPVIVYDQCVEKGKWKPEGLAICREAGVQVDLGTRAAFTEEELSNHYSTISFNSQRYFSKRNAISEFRTGRRLIGLRCALHHLVNEPLSIKAWAILLFGLLGPKPIAWLHKQHLRRKIAATRNKCIQKQTSNFYMSPEKWV
jgi:hypothetical protein